MSLTNVEKKGRRLKNDLISRVQKSIDECVRAPRVEPVARVCSLRARQSDDVAEDPRASQVLVDVLVRAGRPALVAYGERVLCAVVRDRGLPSRLGLSAI